MTDDRKPITPRRKGGIPSAAAPAPLPTQCPHGWEFLPPPFDARAVGWEPLTDDTWTYANYTMSLERITDNEATDECEWALRVRDGDGGTYTLMSGTRQECQGAVLYVRGGSYAG